MIPPGCRPTRGCAREFVHSPLLSWASVVAAAHSSEVSVASITLAPITPDNLRTVLALQTTPEQQRFVAPVPISLAQASLSPHAYTRVILHGSEPVGFLMLEVGERPGVVYLWRFLIDHRHQGRGHGRAAIEALIALVGGWGVPRLELSYQPGEGNPGPFYRRLGFVETGEIEEGEHVMGMDLPTGEGSPPTARRQAAAAYEAAALQLEAAARHARVAARHLREDLVPRASAHALAARGHLLEATDGLDALARLHAAHAEP